MLSVYSKAASTKGNANEENVIAQMNYCITTLTNIVHNKSMVVLEHESDQIVNNLTMEQIVGLYEIRDFRVELLDGISKFEITEEERSLMKRISSIKRDNLKWNALSNALNPTMLLTGNAGPGMAYQAAFQALLSAARTAVEYKSMEGEQNIEELQAMWELRKEDLKEINEIRKSALTIVYSLYDKYHLSESDRLTEATANAFNDYVKEPDAAKRVRLLEDNYNTYKRLAEYYYYLGMSYIDLNKYEKAKPMFDTYLQLYSKAPILRYDERSGCIALAKLTYEKGLSVKEKEALVAVVLKNLPNNSAALLQCVMVYLNEIHQEVKAYQLLRSGIDNPNASDKELLIMAASNMLTAMAKYPAIYTAITNAIEKCDNIGFDSYSIYLMNKTTSAWKALGNLIKFNNVNRGNWYCLWLDNELNNNLEIILPEKYLFSLDDIYIYKETHKEGELRIQQLIAEYANAITEDDIEDVDCFKANKNLKYLFVDVLVPNKVYRIKNGIDYEKIKDGSYPRMSEFTLSDDDVNDIIDFCEDNTQEAQETVIECKESEGDKETLDSINGAEVVFCGDSLRFTPHHSPQQNGEYLRIVFRNGESLLYKFNSEEGALDPYLYATKNNKVFANKLSQDEYEAKALPPKEVVEESSWYEDAWNFVCSGASWIWNGICWLGNKIANFFVWLWGIIAFWK